MKKHFTVRSKNSVKASTSKKKRFVVKASSYVKSDDEIYDDIQEISQEFTSENTSINSTKLPAVFKMVNFEPGTINIDYGGGRFDNVADYLTQYDVINLVYDPYNRSKEHNAEVVKTVRAAGGADTATCSNVLNVIKEPEVRLNVLNNIKKLVKPGGKIYITVYEGSGKGDEGPTKSGYQLNRKTADYIEEIQQVFPDATRKGKLIQAINASTTIQSATVEELQAGMKQFNDKSKKVEKQLDSLKDRTMKRFGRKDKTYAADNLSITLEDAYEIAKSTLNPNYGSISNTITGPSETIPYDKFYINQFDVGLYIVYEESNLIKVEDGETYQLSGTYKSNIEFKKFIERLNNNSNQMYDDNYSVNAADILPGPGDYDPPEYDEPDEVEFSEQIEVDLDCIIVIDSDGSWEYEDTAYPWAQGFGSNGTWYTDEHNVYLGDPVDIVECIDDMLQAYLPDTPGRYQLYGTATLSFNISDIYRTSSFQGMDEDNDPIIDEEFYRDDANAEFDISNSYITNFDCEPLE